MIFRIRWIPAVLALALGLWGCASIQTGWEQWTGMIETQTHRDQALKHMDAGDWEKARQEYQWVIDHYPKRPEAESARRWVRALQKLSACQEENAQLKADSEKLKETLKDLNRMERSMGK